MHSIPGDLVDFDGTFSFLEDLSKTGRLWDLWNFRIPLVPRGTVYSKDFEDNTKASSYARACARDPAQSLPYV